MSRNIEHTGTVLSAAAGTAHIRICRFSACSSCHMHQACPQAEKEEKIIEVHYGCKTPQIGDSVTIVATESMAGTAVRLAYLYPLMLLLAVLFVSWRATGREEWAGIAAVCSLPFYYLILYLFRNQLKKKIIFKIKEE